MSKTITILDEFKINYLTQAQYDAEVAGGTVQPDELYLTPSADYSTSEVNTGQKWIDGKPIYRKVIPFTSMNFSKLTVNVQIIDSSITKQNATLIKYSGQLSQDSLPWNRVSNVTISGTSILYPLQSIWMDLNNNGVRILANFTTDTYASDYSAKSGFVIIEYTKTT